VAGVQVLERQSFTPQLWVKSLQNPRYFFALCTGVWPYEWQVDYIQNDSLFETLRVSRQGGKSLTTAVKVVREALLKPNQFIVIVSPTREQSHIIFRSVSRILENIELRVKGTVKNLLQTRVQLFNNSWIYVTSRTAVRGHTITRLVVDEAAFVEDDVYTAARPALAASNGKITLISTTFGKSGYFYDSHTSLDHFKRWHVPYTLIPHLNEEFVNAEKATMTEVEFSQEYLAEFVETADNFLTREEIMSMIDEDATDIGQQPLPAEIDHDWYDYYLGVDLARMGLDESTYVVVRHAKRGDEPIKVLHVEGTSKMPATDAIGRIKALHEAYRFHTIYVDESFIGGAVVDKMRIEDKLPVKPVNFAGSASTSTDDSNKEAMYKNLQWLLQQNLQAMRDGRERSLTGFPHQKMMNQLSALKYEFTSNGKLKVHHPDGGHDDYPDGLALALFFCAGRKYYPLSLGGGGKPGSSHGPIVNPSAQRPRVITMTWEDRLKGMRKIGGTNITQGI
jgi:hypothetical protein